MNNKLKIKENLANLPSYFLRWRQQILILLIVIAIMDYGDFGFAVGWGLLSRQYKTNLIEIIVATFLLLTLHETQKASKEALRQTELTLRPYMRLAWVTEQIKENRTTQGTINTCILVSNNGRGLMRKVNYEVKVKGKKILVRSHPLIAPGSSTYMVYGIKNKTDMVLGCPNKKFLNDENNRIIKKNKIEISGWYRDVEGRQYRFGFESDTNAKSWFCEKHIQGLIPKHSPKY